jgi:hypothetical protein
MMRLSSQESRVLSAQTLALRSRTFSFGSILVSFLSLRLACSQRYLKSPPRPSPGGKKGLGLMSREAFHQPASSYRTQAPFNFVSAARFLRGLLEAGEYFPHFLFQLAKIRGLDKVGLCSPGHKFLLIMPWERIPLFLRLL